MRFFKAASLIFSPSWMSMARLTFPSRLELNRPAGSFNAAPLANVSLTTLLYVSPVQTMPPWDQTGVPGDVALAPLPLLDDLRVCRVYDFAHFSRAVFPRQSASSLIFASIDAEAEMNAAADSIGTGP